MPEIRHFRQRARKNEKRAVMSSSRCTPYCANLCAFVSRLLNEHSKPFKRHVSWWSQGVPFCLSVSSTRMYFPVSIVMQERSPRWKYREKKSLWTLLSGTNGHG